MWNVFLNHGTRHHPEGEFVRVENSAQNGTPDVVACLDGVAVWVELKVADNPARATTRVAVDHFTYEQRLWGFDWCRAGGLSWLLLQVGRHYYLIRGSVACVAVGKATGAELADISQWHGDSLARAEFWAALIMHT